LEEDADDGDVGDGSECDAGGGGGSSKNKLLNWGFCKLITKGELGGLVAGSSIRLHDDGMLISIRPTSMEGGDGRYVEMSKQPNRTRSPAQSVGIPANNTQQRQSSRE
jgi:hypothetical protein